MSDPWAWRERHVERLELGLGDHVRVSSTYQLVFPAELLAPMLDPRCDHVRVWVPISSRPKRPLLDFDLRGPAGGRAHLLRRADIARIQAGYLAALVQNTDSSELLSSRWPRPVLRAVCEFTPDVFHSFEVEYGRPFERWPRTDLERAYHAYLTKGLAIEIAPDQVSDWIERQRRGQQLLASALEEPPDPYSSSEQPLLALPRIAASIRNADDVTEIIERYVEGVEIAGDVGATELLTVLADFGRRWQVLVDTVVPVEAPCSLGLAENRPLQPDPRTRAPWATNTLEHDVILVDAESSHIEVQVSDHRVEIVSYDVRRPDGSTIGLSHWEGARHTREFLSLYSAEADRAALGRLTVRLAPIPSVRWPAAVILALTFAALATALVVDFPPTEALVAFTLLTFPTTFAVALLLLRESTALAARLQWRMRVSIMATTGVLWTIVLARLLGMSGLVT